MLYFTSVLYYLLCTGPITSQTAERPRQKYIRGWILSQARKIDSGVSPIPPLLVTDVKSVNLASSFAESDWRCFRAVPSAAVMGAHRILQRMQKNLTTFFPGLYQGCTFCPEKKLTTFLVVTLNTQVSL